MMAVDQPATQETILVVEDDVLVRMPIAQYLRDCGYKVIEAVNADEAMTVLLQQETVVDIVFSAIEMSASTDGFGLSKWVREHRPGLDVILTGTVPRAVNAAKELCDDGPMPKPYEPRAVHDQIRRLLAARNAKRHK
jgi:DNA-binding NtrC family response regulator